MKTFTETFVYHGHDYKFTESGETLTATVSLTSGGSCLYRASLTIAEYFSVRGAYLEAGGCRIIETIDNGTGRLKDLSRDSATDSAV